MTSTEGKDPGAKGRKVLAIALGVGFGLGLFSLAAVSALESSYHGDTEAVFARLEADGLSADLEVLLPPEPPQDQNTALALREVFDRLERLSEDEQFELVSMASMRFTNREMFELDYPVDSEERKRHEGLVESGLKKLEPLDEPLGRALGFGACRFEVKWENGLAAELAHLMQIKDLLFVLQYRSLRAISAGRVEEGWRDVERMTALTDLLREPLLIGHLVRIACSGITVKTIEEGLKIAPPAPEQGARLGRLLQKLELPDGISRGFRGELAMACDMLDRLVDPDSPWDEDALGPRPKEADQALLAGLFVARNKARYAEIMEGMIRATAESEDKARGAIAAYDKQAQAMLDGSVPLASMMIPAAGKALEKDYEQRAQVRLAFLALRLAAEETLPDRLSSAPPDPFAPGRALRWRKDGETSGVLYSVGRDGQDDGGKAPDYEKSENAGDPGTDFVFVVSLPDR